MQNITSATPLSATHQRPLSGAASSRRVQITSGSSETGVLSRRSTTTGLPSRWSGVRRHGGTRARGHRGHRPARPERPDQPEPGQESASRVEGPGAASPCRHGARKPPSFAHSPTILRYPQREFPPAGVLAAHADGQPHGARVKAAPGAVAPVRIGPAATDQFPVPAHQRRGRDQKHRPAFAREQPGQRGQHQAIRRGVPGPGDLTTQHQQLVAQHRDLHVAGRSTDPHVAPHRLPVCGRSGLGSAPLP
jgi:hypothetical protein